MIELILVLAFAFFMIFYLSLSWGFVFYKFWYWFLLPIFPMVPEITYHHAIALYLMTSFLRTYNITAIKTNDANENALIGFITPWLLLGMGYMIKEFIF